MSFFDRQRQYEPAIAVAAFFQNGIAAALFFQALAGKPFWPE
jgi:hypothetical protein